MKAIKTKLEKLSLPQLSNIWNDLLESKTGSSEDITDKFTKAVKGDKKPKGKNTLKEGNEEVQEFLFSALQSKGFNAGSSNQISQHLADLLAKGGYSEIDVEDIILVLQSLIESGLLSSGNEFTP